jgi:hypothetical protein
MIVMLVFNLCGCTGGEFDAVLPPINEFPTPAGYETTEVIIGNFVVEKSIRGNKQNNGLQARIDPANVKDFHLNEKGYVVYDINGKIYKLDATITVFPNGISNEFRATHDYVSSDIIPSNWPGKFNVVVFEQNDCKLLSKKAVSMFDDAGTAIVYVVDENGLLKEKSIKVGLSNDTYYQILEGVSVGEKVVIR